MISSDLTKTLNLAAGTITLGISSTLEARIAATELLPFYCCGTIDCGTTPPTIIADKGRVSFTVVRNATGVHDITFATALPNNQYAISTTSMRDCDQIRELNTMNETLSASGFRILTKHRNGTLFDTIFSFMVYT